MWFIKHIKTGEILSISKAETSVGRSNSTFVIKNDESISRKHCTLILADDGLKIIDNGSKYGTSVNMESNKIAKIPVQLKSGDRIHFGCFENIWEVNYKPDNTEAHNKRRLDAVDQTTNENSLSSSNVNKKLKQDEIIAKSDVVLDSSDDEMPVNRTRTRARKNVIYSVSALSGELSMDKSQPLKLTQKMEEAVGLRSQLVIIDSDDDIFATSTQNTQTSKKVTAGTSKKDIDDDDIFSFDISNKRAGAKTVSRKRPPAEPAKAENAKKMPRLTQTAKDQVAQESENNATMQSVTSTSKERTTITKPSETSYISRRRDPIKDDDLFNFEVSERRVFQRPKLQAKNDQENNDVTDSRQSKTSVKQAPAYKTTNLCNKELYASFDYKLDENDGGWLSTKISDINVNVKEENSDETENAQQSFNPPCRYVANFVQKTINLDASSDSTKNFRKQKYQESDQTVKLKKMSVKDVNAYYLKEDSNVDWS